MSEPIRYLLLAISIAWISVCLAFLVLASIGMMIDYRRNKRAIKDYEYLYWLEDQWQEVEHPEDLWGK